MKKIFPYILIAAIVVGAVLSPVPFGVREAQAGCNILSVFGADSCLDSVLKGIGYVLLTLGSWILGAAGVIFDQAVRLSVVDMKSAIDTLGVITAGWTTFRDLANIGFIFIVIFIAISTILQLDQYGIRRLLAKVLLVALLINFSLFTTKVIVDASNIIALSFYNAIDVQTQPVSGPAVKTGISGAFMSAFSLTSLYQPVSLSGAGPLPTAPADAKTTGARFFLIGLVGMVVMFIAAFIFFVASALFVIRFVVIVFLMVLSPLAFLAMVLPKAKGMANKWWSTLFSQSFFAPLFMMLAWFVVTVINNPEFQKSLAGPGGDNSQLSWTAAFASAPGGAAKAIGQVFLNFFVVTVFLIAALIIAKSLASSGVAAVQTAVGWSTKKMGGVFTRNTVGRLGSWAKSDKWGAGYLAKKVEGSRVAKYTGLNMALRGIKKVGEKGEDLAAITPGGFGDFSRATARERREKRVESGIRERKQDPEQLARYMVSLRESERKHAYEKLSARDRAEVEEALRRNPRTAAMAHDLRMTLAIEDRDKVDDEVVKVRQGTLARANRENINTFAASHPSTSVLAAADITNIDSYMASLRPNQARRLSPAARTNLYIVERLSPAQLEDILRNTTDLETTEMRTIRTIVLGSGTAASQAYMTTGNSATLWNV